MPFAGPLRIREQTGLGSSGTDMPHHTQPLHEHRVYYANLLRVIRDFDQLSLNTRAATLNGHDHEMPDTDDPTKPEGDDIEIQDDGDVYYSYDEAENDEDENHNPNDDSESEDDLHPHKASTKTEKRRVQDSIFASYAAKKTEKITQEEVQDALVGAKDEILSIQDILRKQENSTRITTSRDYQVELFQRAKAANIIAVLDTGTGKTHIATLLLRHILDQELEARARGDSPKIAFFLVDSVNLVFQQANVLRCGLDQQVVGVCGAMGASLWQQPTWEKHFKNNMAIVCTAEILVECMMHSFITISQVNLLIFDEAHHAKNNHPYARLMREYYVNEPDVTKRPRIFGMTASPVDGKDNVRRAATDLETLLHAKIATASEDTLIANNIVRPVEEVASYPRLREPFETALYQALHSRYGHIGAFAKFFNASKQLSAELGAWASDRYWLFAISEEESNKIERRQTQRFYRQQRDETAETLDRDIAQLREAAEYVRQHEFRPATRTPEDLSPKVLELLRRLDGYYCRTGDSLSIIFAERRGTVRLLQMIISQLGGPHIHSDILVGVNSRIGEQNVSLRSQVMTLSKFRRNELNCIISTSVAEEGLDIPGCNLVVRFDLYRTMIGYVQSRGRARHRNSKYLHMVELLNVDHMATVTEAKKSELVMRAFCNDLPRDQILDSIVDAELAMLLEDEQSLPSFTDPTTNAKLTYRSSLSILSHYVATAPTKNREEISQPTYVVSYEEGNFICEVTLPEYVPTPLSSVRGKPCRKKAVAKSSAAYEMCLKLHESNHLDSRFLPTIAKALPAMRNAMLAISEKNKGMYNMRIKPKLWMIGYDSLPDMLYLTVIDVSHGLERPHQPLGFITRVPFPEIPQFPIFLNDGRPSMVVTTPIATAMTATAEILELFTKLTLQVYSDMFAKVFEQDTSKMSYWLVPVRSGAFASAHPACHTPGELIDWAQVHEICDKGEYRWTPTMSNDFLADKYIVDNWDGGRRFYSNVVAPHLKPKDPVPDSVPRHKYMDNILDYSVSLWTKSRERKVWDLTQPVLEVEKIPFRRNLLALVEKDEDEVKMKPIAWVCPEPLRISALTTRFVAMCYVFPAIIHRYDSNLIALDACRLLGLEIGPHLALEAVTKDTDDAEGSDDPQITFKSGMGPNYERLEFMGDCFLKMATSIATFVQQPDESEFEFHVRRMCMLCNKNLFKVAVEYKLYEYVRTMAFSRRTWYPEGLKLTKGKGHKRTGPQVIKHSLGDKSVADVSEALIGAAFMQHNQRGRFDSQNWDEAVKAVKVLVKSEDHVMEKWSDYYAAYEEPSYLRDPTSASQLDMARQIEKKHPYRFHHPRLVRSAFTCGKGWEGIPNYQRLEFLGDALLDQVFIMHIFYKHPNEGPQWLTEHKMPMVCNKFLGALCVKIGFHVHLRIDNAKDQSRIRDYVMEVEEAEADARTNHPDDYALYWNSVSEPPKCLADIVEAYVGAMFVDAKFDFTVVQNFFHMHIKCYFEDMHKYDGWAQTNPVTRLDTLMKVNFGCKDFRIGARECPSVIPGAKSMQLLMVQIHGKVWFDATGESIKYAKPRVASKAYHAMEGLPPYEFKRRYGCDCKDETEVDEEEEQKKRLEELARDMTL
ncbi:dicer-like protein 1 [Amniculicola lignicola CBS 123094]|uniref:Dicer-like protein 1 n=1 Tax=Amniculicola lignicola CBS 123094 TaxID=1392246 RepID=A0A6A5W3V9_9PLEO|nr:dicer-like protein 1 [Amniculicola lignicola CBS 123094]